MVNAYDLRRSDGIGSNAYHFRMGCGPGVASSTAPVSPSAIIASYTSAASGRQAIIILSWAAVLAPIAWGIVRALEKVAVLLN